MAGREDLIGFGPNCLVRPEGAGKRENAQGAPKSGTQKRGKGQNPPKRGEKSLPASRAKAHAPARAAKPKDAVSARAKNAPQGRGAGKTAPKNQAPKRRK
jgi:hypothetical protein